ncbi:transcription initiation protein SPT3 [Nematocida homosporus]|uniref:transcription initiation protein SPT3 n=1 Tax=Nematocida homosporus TaxID=1912981 RepID=UPI002220FAF9|nr:transcription initiation protein SPT3 [Nematocida homosporus]KAI5185369.1 transcription initiation protein SPT3 [Nematocida homosporus]
MNQSSYSMKIEFGSLVRGSDKDKEGQNYQSEIKSMMYACGDVRNPNKASSIYLEQIVYAHIKTLLDKSYEISRLRGSKQVGIEDIVFVLRRNPCRVKKLSNYIVFKDVRNRVNKEVVALNAAKEAKLSYSWLPRNIYDKANELKDRLYAIDRMTENMSKEEYLDFTECRQASFTFRKIKRFKDFLGTDYKLKDEVVDILGFVACEVIFDIVSIASEISARKNKGQSEQAPVEGMFKEKSMKVPITIPDIDEACRLLKEQGVIY